MISPAYGFQYLVVFIHNSRHPLRRLCRLEPDAHVHRIPVPRAGREVHGEGRPVYFDVLARFRCPYAFHRHPVYFGLEADFHLVDAQRPLIDQRDDRNLYFPLPVQPDFLLLRPALVVKVLVQQRNVIPLQHLVSRIHRILHSPDDIRKRLRTCLLVPKSHNSTILHR